MLTSLISDAHAWITEVFCGLGGVLGFPDSQTLCIYPASVVVPGRVGQGLTACLEGFPKNRMGLTQPFPHPPDAPPPFPLPAAIARDAPTAVSGMSAPEAPPTEEAAEGPPPPVTTLEEAIEVVFDAARYPQAPARGGGRGLGVTPTANRYPQLTHRPTRVGASRLPGLLVSPPPPPTTAMRRSFDPRQPLFPGSVVSPSQ